MDKTLEESALKIEFEKATSEAVIIRHYEVERIFLKRLLEYRNHSTDTKFIESIDYIARKVYGDEDFEKYVVNGASLEVKQ